MHVFFLSLWLWLDSDNVISSVFYLSHISEECFQFDSIPSTAGPGTPVSSCCSSGSIREASYSTVIERENSLVLIELSGINRVV
jgi:hypothetical protein